MKIFKAMFRQRRSFTRVLGVILLSLSLALPANAQEEEGASRTSGTRRQLATIIFAGLGGAVLGLSTLSFYGRPQDRLSNIAIGFAIGVIAGTVYVTYNTATSARAQSYLDPAFRDLELTQRQFALSSAATSNPGHLALRLDF